MAEAALVVVLIQSHWYAVQPTPTQLLSGVFGQVVAGPQPSLAHLLEAMDRDAAQRLIDET